VVIVDASVHALLSQFIFLPSGHFPIPLSAIYQSSEQLCPATNALVQPTTSMDVYSFATMAWAVSFLFPLLFIQGQFLIRDKFFQIFAGKEPFSDLSRFRTTQTIVEILHHGHRSLVKPSNMSTELWATLQRCLAADPVLRPTMSEVVAELVSLSW
jgi:hypothetical protein